MLTWIAHYTDGTNLPQQGNNGGPPAVYRDIDRGKLVAFEVQKDRVTLVAIDFRDDTQGQKSEIRLGPKRLIWRRRTSLNASGAKDVIWLVGWQRTATDPLGNQKNIQSVLYINEQTGQSILGGQPIENAPMMHSVKLHSQEV